MTLINILAGDGRIIGAGPPVLGMTQPKFGLQNSPNR
jgi:hypothetical protein